MIYRQKIEKEIEFDGYVSNSDKNSDVAIDDDGEKVIMNVGESEAHIFFDKSVKLQKEGVVSLLNII